MTHQQFKELVNEAVEKFRKISENQVIRIISHLDADGISSGSIIVKALMREGLRYSISNIHQLDEKTLVQLANEDFKVIIFTDLGSGQFELVKKYLKDKQVIILDHHETVDEKVDYIMHVNPHLVGIDESNSVSGAGVAFFFARGLNPKNSDMAHIALAGAMGDMQEENGFHGLNSEIVEIGKQAGYLKVISGLRVFGAQTKPIHIILQRAEFEIPGVTGSESGAIQLLQEVGINPRNGYKWKTLVDLDEDELKKLTTTILMRRLNLKNPEEIIGPVFMLKNEKKGSPLRDLKEFSTILNACGRLDKASFGIGLCIGDEKMKKKALTVMKEYKREITNSLKWYEANKDSENVRKNNGYMIINAKDNVMPTIIGTMASIISYSPEVKPGTLILSLAKLSDEHLKASIRIAGRVKGPNLMELMQKITNQVGGQSGGHMDAAGALIDSDKEEQFLETAQRVLEENSIEETV